MRDEIDQFAEKMTEFIKYWHKGQKDRGGEEYYKHPLYVGKNSNYVAGVLRKDIAFKTESFILGCCHDLLEDTNCTIGDIQRFLYENDIHNAYFYDGNFERDLNLLTRKKDEGYFGYVERISKSELASLVKMIDLIHNSDLSRISNPTTEDEERVAKYHLALQILDDRWRYKARLKFKKEFFRLPS